MKRMKARAEATANKNRIAKATDQNKAVKEYKSEVARLSRCDQVDKAKSLPVPEGIRPRDIRYVNTFIG